MIVQVLVISLAVLLGTLAIAAPLSRWTRLPAPTVQFLVGAIVANSLVAAGIDTGLRFDSFHDLVFYVFLPILVFAAAYELQISTLRRVLPAILALATLGLLLTAFLVGVGVQLGINHPGFPWLAALLTGSLLAATDPAAVTGQESIHTLREDMGLLLEGESLFNDATSVVLFTVILGLTLSPINLDSTQVLASGIMNFVKELTGGLIIGAALGFVGWAMTKRSEESLTKWWLGIAFAFAAFHGAHALHVSGVIAALVCGLGMGHHETGASKAHNESASDSMDAAMWHALSNTANGMLFVLMGATITWSMFAERWLAMLIAIAAVLVARLASVHIFLFATQRWVGTSMAERSLIGMLGMRGAITIALVLILPVELEYWWTIQSIAYGVVLFDLFVLAPLAPWLIRSLTKPEALT